jgi:hypothetical protein
MKHFKLSKYSNSDYENTDDTWTSVSDIGHEFRNEILTRNDYLLVEDKYVEVLHLFLNRPQCNDFKVLRYEDNRGLETNNNSYFNISDPMLKIRGGEILSVDIMLVLFRLCLREVMWLRLQSKSGCYITFGYDFYVNIGVSDEVEIDKKLFESSGLFLRSEDDDPHE